MSAAARKLAVWLIPAIVIGLVVCVLVFPSGPVARNTPFMREYARIHGICSKLRFYAEAHPSEAAGALRGKSVDDLATAGILSADDAQYIRERHIEFRGFDPTRIGGNVPVLEAVFTNATIPRRIIGYSDGSTVAYDLK